MLGAMHSLLNKDDTYWTVTYKILRSAPRWVASFDKIKAKMDKFEQGRNRLEVSVCEAYTPQALTEWGILVNEKRRKLLAWTSEDVLEAGGEEGTAEVASAGSVHEGEVAGSDADDGSVAETEELAPAVKRGKAKDKRKRAKGKGKKGRRARMPIVDSGSSTEVDDVGDVSLQLDLVGESETLPVHDTPAAQLDPVTDHLEPTLDGSNADLVPMMVAFTPIDGSPLTAPTSPTVPATTASEPIPPHVDAIPTLNDQARNGSQPQSPQLLETTNFSVPPSIDELQAANDPMYAAERRLTEEWRMQSDAALDAALEATLNDLQARWDATRLQAETLRQDGLHRLHLEEQLIRFLVHFMKTVSRQVELVEGCEREMARIITVERYRSDRERQEEEEAGKEEE